MKEISLNILDIVENSVKAKATLTEIIIEESEDTLVLTVKDDGCGMSEETVKSVTNPFYTTRKTRKISALMGESVRIIKAPTKAPM